VSTRVVDPISCFLDFITDQRVNNFTLGLSPGPTKCSPGLVEGLTLECGSRRLLRSSLTGSGHCHVMQQRTEHYQHAAGVRATRLVHNVARSSINLVARVSDDCWSAGLVRAKRRAAQSERPGPFRCAGPRFSRKEEDSLKPTFLFSLSRVKTDTRATATTKFDED